MSESSQDLSNKTNNNSVADDMPDSENSTFPGRILSAAREELNYSIEQVAQELHLRPSVVLAMEEEKYDDFSSAVFLKGYFRSYCRLVNLHEERMVDLLETQLRGLQKDIDDAAHLVKKEKQVKKQKKAFIGLLLVAFIVGVFSFLFSLFYNGGEEIVPAELSIEVLSKNTSSVVDDSSSKVLKAAVDTDKTSHEIVNASAEENLNTDVEISNEPVLAVTVDKVVISAPGKKVASINADTNKSEQEIVAEPVVVTSVSEKKETTIDADTIKNEQEIVAEPIVVTKAVSLSKFEATFSGDCWFKLVDGNDKTVFAALKHNGDRISYSGVTPFKVVLGDATKVTLFFDGDTINLKSHTANNGRAQLTLNKG